MVGVLSAVRVRREPRGRLDRHAAARVPAVRRTSTTCIPTGRSRWRPAPTASGSSTSSTAVRPADRLGAVAAARLRAGADAAAGGRGAPGVRRHHARRPRAVHLGRDAARVLSEQHHARSIRWGSSSRRTQRRAGRRAFGGPAVTGTVADRGIGDRGDSSRACAAPSRRTARVDRALATASDDALDVRRTRRWARGAVRDGDELSRSLPAHAHLADVRAVGSAGDDVAALQQRDRRADRTIPRGLRGVLPRVRASPPRRRCATRNPSVVVIPGLGLFGFGKDKREARITTEFFVNAIHVMSGRERRSKTSGGHRQACRRRAGRSRPRQFKTFHNYVALPRLEAFRIEYWALEEAKLQRMPPEREFSRKIVRGRRRRQRHRPRGRAAARRGAAGTWSSPTRTRGCRRGDAAEPRSVVVAGDGAVGRRSI